MDYRERKYYLVRFNYFNKVVSEIKREIPSIKIHEPYNHFRDKSKINTKDIYDGEKYGKYIQVMISCRKEYSYKFEFLMMSMAMHNKFGYIYCAPVTKEELKQ